MYSAFGVDHGETVSKAVPGWNSTMRAVRGTRAMASSARAAGKGRRSMKAGKKARDAARAARATENATSMRNAQAKATGFVDQPISISGIGRGVSSGVGSVGRGTSAALGKYPGVTGTAVLGAGGYGVYRAGKSGEKRKSAKNNQGL